MTKHLRGRVFLSTAVLVAALLNTTLLGQGPAAQFTISGTSTVRGWTCPAEGAMDVILATAAEPLPGFPNGLQAVRITVPVKAIMCPEEQMIEHLRESMEEPQHPEIVYELESYRFTSDDSAVASGTLAIHGTTRPVTFEIQLVETSDGVRGVGQTSITLSDFGITPPSLWRGMLNVGDVVEVKFDAPLPRSN